MERKPRTSRFAATLPFPDRSVEWVREGGLHLQWRDRAGFDRLPCYAQLGTEGTYSVVKLRLLQPPCAERVKRAHESMDAARVFRERLGQLRLMKEPIPTLEAIGFDAQFKGQVAALGDDLVPARIAIAHGESYIAWTERGSCKAVLAGNRAHWKEAIDRPQVGDWVAGSFSESLDALLVAHLLERRTCLVRQASGKRPEPQVIAANVDVVGIVSAFGEGKSARDRRLINEPRVRRYLAIAEQSRAQPILIVNKIDLSADPQAVTDPFAQTFPGIPVVLTSALNGLGLDGLRPWLPPGKTLALIGMSGVGKSTLVNALVGRAAQRTGEVRESDARGRHTTTHRELIVMESGALLIDTPGMRELGLWETEGGTIPEGVGDRFDDVIAIAAACRFGDCRHVTEPGCAIREALETGRLSAERWTSYQAHAQKLDNSQTSSSRRGRSGPRASPGPRKR